MAFVRVTDPDVAQELYQSRLLYEQPRDDPIILAWGWSESGWEYPLSCETGSSTCGWKSSLAAKRGLAEV